MAVAKKVQGKSPAQANRGYGRFPDETWAMRPKKMAKTIIIVAGCRMAQAAPSTVCLYRTLTSRQTKDPSNSRYNHSSRKLINCQRLGGRITVTGGVFGCPGD